MKIVPPVLEQHGEEAALKWLRRDRAVAEPHYSLKDLAKLDGQLEANLDGLRIAEATTANAAWDLCERELSWGEPGEVFAAAVLAFESCREDRVHAVLDVSTASYELSRPLVSALGWLPWNKASSFVARLLVGDDPVLRRIGIAASAVHRRDPGPVLADALKDPDELLRARALRAVGELGRVDLLEAVRQHVGEEALGCRSAAGWSTVLMSGDAEAVAVLQAIVDAGQERSLAALQLALRRMVQQEAKAWLLELAPRGPDKGRSTVIGAGVLGAPELVPWLIERLQTAELARVAGEALAMITGLDIAYQDVDGPWPEGFTAGPTEDPQDENVAMDPDENLPWPDAEKIAAWWAKHRGDFTPGSRYLLGRPLTEEWLEDALRNGYQRQRAAAALELAIRHPGQPLFEVRAPGFRQQQWLGLK